MLHGASHALIQRSRTRRRNSRSLAGQRSVAKARGKLVSACIKAGTADKLDDTRQALAGGSYLMTEEYGQGQVVLFASEPAYRAYWPALHRLFLNAILLARHI